MANILAYQTIPIGSYPEYMVVGIVMKFDDAVANQLFKLSFVLNSTYNFIIGSRIVFCIELHFIHEAFVRDGEAVVFQVANTTDGCMFVVCQVVGNLHLLEGLFF